MRIKSSQPRKQRKALYNMPDHRRAKAIAAHLDNKLIDKYHIRTFPVRKGDIVRIIRGDKYIPDKKEGKTGVKGREGKVVEVDRKTMKLVIEGVTIAKADKKQKPLKIHPSNVKIVKLDLSDPSRRKKIERCGKIKLEEELEETEKEEEETENVQ